MAAKNIDLSSLINKIGPIKQKILQYLQLVFIVLVLGIYSFLVFRINNLIESEPSDEAVTEQLKTAQRPKIDQESINKLQQLEDNSTDVQALFKAARENPFQE